MDHLDPVDPQDRLDNVATGVNQDRQDLLVLLDLQVGSYLVKELI